jgi:hypothetical protein
MTNIQALHAALAMGALLGLASGSALAAQARDAAITAGQTRAEIHALVGEPDSVRTVHLHLCDTWTWILQNPDNLSDHGYLEVHYKNGKVTSAERGVLNKHVKMVSSVPVPKQARERRNWSGIAEKVANVAANGYLSWACPAAYRKPWLFMTNNDVQLMQLCNANGFMLFGLYVYTGGR